MSLWCSFSGFDDDDGEYPAPIVYQRSHVLPSPDDARGGSLDLAYVPGFITRDGRDRNGVWPWLRVSLRPVDWQWHGGEDTIILDRDQVEQLRDELSDWLLRADTWLVQHEARMRAR